MRYQAWGHTTAFPQERGSEELRLSRTGLTAGGGVTPQAGRFSCIACSDAIRFCCWAEGWGIAGVRPERRAQRLHSRRPAFGRAPSILLLALKAINAILLPYGFCGVPGAALAPALIPRSVPGRKIAPLREFHLTDNLRVYMITRQLSP
jgi:hypothetical protein